MEVIPSGNYLMVDKQQMDTSYLSELKKMLMGYVDNKGSAWLKVEDNVVNRIVLGLDPLGYRNERPVEAAPESLNSNLEKYQKADVQKGVRLGNFLNLNRMGFGKTVETIETLRLLNARDVVIVAPKSVCSQWKDQYAVWWPEMHKHVSVFKTAAPVVVLNYEKLLQTSVMAKLRNHRHDAVVFDEVHKLKGRDSKRTTQAKLIPAGVHIGLTGTPILNQPDDLWSQLHSVDWRYSGMYYWNFVEYFCNVEQGEFGKKINGLTKNPSHLAILKTLLDLVTIRNGEVQVAHGKRRVDILLDMSAKQKALYNNIKNLVLAELPENCTISNGAVLVMRLQQTTSWPGLFEVSEPGSKFEWVAEFCSNTTEQVVVISRFEKSAAALQQYLAKKGIGAVLYTGKQKPKEQANNKRQFISGKCQVIIGTIGAMGEGVDGLQVARLGIMLERSWSPEINEQCEDRLHRRGQKDPVLWYYLSCRGTFDKHVSQINITKADSIRLALETDD